MSLQKPPHQCFSYQESLTDIINLVCRSPSPGHLGCTSGPPRLTHQSAAKLRSYQSQGHACFAEKLSWTDCSDLVCKHEHHCDSSRYMKMITPYSACMFSGSSHIVLLMQFIGLPQCRACQSCSASVALRAIRIVEAHMYMGFCCRAVHTRALGLSRPMLFIQQSTGSFASYQSCRGTQLHGFWPSSSGTGSTPSARLTLHIIWCLKAAVLMSATWCIAASLACSLVLRCDTKSQHVSVLLAPESCLHPVQQHVLPQSAACLATRQPSNAMASQTKEIQPDMLVARHACSAFRKDKKPRH